MAVLKGLLWLLLGGAAALLAAGQLGALRGQAPGDLGVRDGRLKPPSKTPNSVSSQADLWPDHPQRAYARIAPLALVNADGAHTITALRALLQRWPGATLAGEQPGYLYVQFRTRVLGFVDDAEFWFDPQAQAVQLRSASRIGRKDFGVNRARIESLRLRLAESP